MADLSDRRKESRKKVMAFTPVYDLKKGKVLGYLRDLTMKGAQVNGEKKQEVNTQITLSIKLPDDLPEVTSKKLNIKARVKRCIAVPENPNNYEIGFEFSDSQPEQKEIIEKLLERYHLRHKIY